LNPCSKKTDPEAAGRMDADFMGVALEEARLAFAEDDVPVGAVVVQGREVIARGHNRTRLDCDPTAHAEMIAMRSAARSLGYQRLDGCTLYTTVEPCFMCAGAAVHARVARVVWGVRDPKFGGAVSLGSVLCDPHANHRADLTEGVCAEECRDLMQSFFEGKRRSKTRESGENN